MGVCLRVAPKLYEKSESANATDTNMTFATETIYASCIFMLCVYVCVFVLCVYVCVCVCVYMYV